MNKEIRGRRSSMLWHFSKAGKYQSKGDDSIVNEGPITCLSIANDGDDWVIDMDAATCEVSQIWRLDRYSLEHIITLLERAKLLLLVKLNDDSKHFFGESIIYRVGTASHYTDYCWNRVLSTQVYYQRCIPQWACHFWRFKGSVLRGSFSKWLQGWEWGTPCSF